MIVKERSKGYNETKRKDGFKEKMLLRIEGILYGSGGSPEMKSRWLHGQGVLARPDSGTCRQICAHSKPGKRLGKVWCDAGTKGYRKWCVSVGEPYCKRNPWKAYTEVWVRFLRQKGIDWEWQRLKLYENWKNVDMIY